MTGSTLESRRRLAVAIKQAIDTHQSILSAAEGRYEVTQSKLRRAADKIESALADIEQIYWDSRQPRQREPADTR